MRLGRSTPLHGDQKNKTVTLSYFGNIQNKLIGQIKTKVPIKDRNSVIKFADTAMHDEDISFRNDRVQHAKLKYRDVQETATVESSERQNTEKGRHDQRLAEKRFYDKIGEEPYIVSKYCRPNGLTSQKLSKQQDEDEIEFGRKKALFKLEQDIKMQNEIIKNRNAVLRGSMLKEENYTLNQRRHRQSSVSALKPSTVNNS